MPKPLTLLCLLCALALSIGLHQTARAADAVVGAGFPASCTEAAFDAALSTASSSGGSITFDCGPNPHSIVFTSAKILPADVVIDGAKMITLSGGGATRLFQVAGSPVTLANLHLTQGHAALGGAIQVTAGGQLTLRDSQLSENTADNAGGGLYNDGGDAILTGVTLTDNSAPYGGGIFNTGALTLTDVTLAGNVAASGGGGLYNNQLASLSNVTLAGNTSGDGGGLFNAGGAVITLNNATISGNQANYGGGLYNNGEAQLTNVTVAENSAQAGGGVLHNSGAAPQITLLNVILAGNVASSAGDQCLFYKAPAAMTYSLWSGESCGDSPANGNQPNTEALLAPLGFTASGLPTELTMTHALLAGSPAVDAGDCAGAPTNDQRGVERPQGATCDAGAVERIPELPAVYLPLLIRQTP